MSEIRMSEEKYNPTSQELIDSQSPSEELFSTEGYVPADAEDIAAAQAQGTVLNVESPLSETLGDNAELARLAKQFVGESVDAKTAEPIMPGAKTESTSTSEQKGNVSKEELAREALITSLRKGLSPLVTDAYRASAIATLRTDRETLATIQKELNEAGIEVDVNDLIKKVMDGSGDTVDTVALKDTSIRRAGFGKSGYRPARHTAGVAESDNTPVGPSEGTRGDTPDITDVDDKTLTADIS